MSEDRQESIERRGSSSSRSLKRIGGFLGKLRRGSKSKKDKETQEAAAAAAADTIERESTVGDSAPPPRAGAGAGPGAVGASPPAPEPLITAIIPDDDADAVADGSSSGIKCAAAPEADDDSFWGAVAEKPAEASAEEGGVSLWVEQAAPAAADDSLWDTAEGLQIEHDDDFFRGTGGNDDADNGRPRSPRPGDAGTGDGPIDAVFAFDFDEVGDAAAEAEQMVKAKEREQEEEAAVARLKAARHAEAD